MKTAKRSITWLAAFLPLVLAACNLPSAAPPTPRPTARATARPTRTAAMEPTSAPAPAPALGAEEAIMLLAPGPASRLVSPLHVAGVADPLFEQTLDVRLVAIDGAEIASGTAFIAADVGQRGPFEGDLPFSVSAEQNALLQVFARSARDGGVTHLASVGVTLAASGPAQIVAWSPYPEQIVIQQPASGASVSGTLHVEGVGTASFEGTLVIEAFDADGNLLASQPVITAAPDIGMPGLFAVDLMLPSGLTGPGRVVVRDPSPAFGGDVHLASVEVRYGP